MRIFMSILALGLLTAVSAASDWRDAALEEVKTERAVIEAMFSQSISLWVSVRDDGTRRDGFARYLCLVLSDAGKPTDEFVVVHVWDAAKMARQEMVELGKAECS